MRKITIFGVIFLLFLIINSSYVAAGCIESQSNYDSYILSLMTKGQGFTASCSGKLEIISLLTKDSMPDITIQIYNGLEGEVGSPIWSESFTAQEGDGPTDHIYILSNGPTLNASGTYSLIIEGGFWKPYAISSNEYNGGTFLEDNSKVTNKDLVFSLTIGNEAGDINNDMTVNLKDLILILKICAGIEPDTPVNLTADVNGDGKIDMEEAIYVLAKVAGTRN